MPPKGWRKTATGFQPTNSSGVNIKDRKVHGIEELLLPRALVARIAKQSLPANTPLPKDGVTALLRGITMFTSYITAEANQFARQESRKTVTHGDILRALESCQFGSFIQQTSELSEKMVVKTRNPADSSKPGDAAAANDGDTTAQAEEDDDYIEEDVEPQVNLSMTMVMPAETKRARLSVGDSSTADAGNDSEMQVEQQQS